MNAAEEKVIMQRLECRNRLQCLAEEIGDFESFDTGWSLIH